MVERNWLITCATLAGKPLQESEADQIATELGEEREVLPWLLLARGGFAGWHETRMALEEAAKAVIPLRMLSQTSAAVTAQEHRETYTKALLRSMTGVRRIGQAAVKDIGQVRRRASVRLQPHDFIGEL